MQKITMKTKAVEEWKEIVIKAGGKELAISVNQNGYALVHTSTSNMEIRFPLDKNLTVMGKHPSGQIHKLKHIKN